MCKWNQNFVQLIIKIIQNNNLKIPKDMYKNVEVILKLAAGGSTDILLEINKLVDNLDILLSNGGLIIK